MYVRPDRRADGAIGRGRLASSEFKELIVVKESFDNPVQSILITLHRGSSEHEDSVVGGLRS